MKKQEVESARPSTKTQMSRRELLLGVLTSVGSVGALSSLVTFKKAFALSLTNQSTSDFKALFYTPSEFSLISTLADVIIPETDTPGALNAGVPILMDNLFNQWASAGSQAKHRLGIAAIEVELTKIAGGSILKETKDSQFEALLRLDTLAFEKRTTALQTYIDVKSLIAKFYYLSKPGATKELRYERIPGRWQASIPFEQVGRTWAK
jgi:gluconate 2-dehydrogenase gamma chain